ncbi:MAG: CBS domain-containing protein [Saprospiraceae bacterium]|nr:CBS domain-containing protein [Saprospiraceae bacterium]
MKNIPVTEVMTKNLVTISHKSSLDDAERLMRKNHIRHLPVVKSGKLVGIISLTDILRLSFGDTYQEDEEVVDVAVFNMLTLESVMVNHPTTININQTVMDAAQILAEKEFHALPVVDGEKVVGIVTTTDLIKFFVKNLN